MSWTPPFPFPFPFTFTHTSPATCVSRRTFAIRKERRLLEQVKMQVVTDVQVVKIIQDQPSAEEPTRGIEKTPHVQHQVRELSKVWSEHVFFSEKKRRLSTSRGSCLRWDRWMCWNFFRSSMLSRSRQCQEFKSWKISSDAS